MAIGDLNPAVWRVDIYEMKPKNKNKSYISDLSNFYTSDLSITKQRNYPDEIRFTLDLQQLEERAKLIGIESRQLLEPYVHKVKLYRNNKFMAQAIVTKVDVSLNNQSKNTVEVSCVDILGIFEKRLIHQDYAEGSWADFAAKVVMDAQHEPNRIYNYAFEGDGVSIENVWFRGWKFTPGEDASSRFPDWVPNHLYSMYDTCTYDAKFWEAKEHAFYSGETFTESNWTLLGILDPETGDVAPVYGVWREDDEDPGPTGTHLGGWGGTSSCHMTANTFQINNGTLTEVSMKDSSVSTSLVAPYANDPIAPHLPDDYQEVEYIENTYGKTSAKEVGPFIDTGVIPVAYDARLKVTMEVQFTTGTSFSIDHTLIGSSTGTSGGTFYWNPQYHICTNTSGRWAAELPMGKSPSSNVVQLISNSSAGTSKREIVLDTTEPNNSRLYVDGTLVASSTTTVTGGADAPLGIFSRIIKTPSSTNKNGQMSAPIKLYSCRIEDSRGNLIRNFIPCKRKLDDNVGLYDMVYGRFYKNDNHDISDSNPFIAGPEITARRPLIVEDAFVEENPMISAIKNKELFQSLLSSFDEYDPNVLDHESANALTLDFYADDQDVVELSLTLEDGYTSTVTLALISSVWDILGEIFAFKQNIDPELREATAHINLEANRIKRSEDRIHTRVMAKNGGNANSVVRLYLESYGGGERTYSQSFTVTGSNWNELSYDFQIPSFDTYRMGIRIISGDVLVDSPVIYMAPKTGDVWDLGVRVGVVPTAEEQEAAGWLKTRFTPTFEWKNAKETLLDLSNMDSDNFWYAIDENYKFNIWVNQGSPEIKVNLSYPKNITSMSVSTNANDVFNFIKGDGSAEVTQDPLVSGVVNDNGAPFTWIEQDTASMEKYWALAEAVAYNSERTIESLKTDLRTEIANSAIMQDVPTIKIQNNAVTPDQIGLGDIVTVEVSDIPYVRRVNGLYKIIGYDIDVDIDGNESMSLTLLNPTENQINALSFPQLIKNLINRLHGAR